MNERWMKSGNSGQPHWVKLFGSERLTTACGVVLTRSLALNVDTQKVGLANAPTKHVNLPLESHCEICARKAKEQA
jgi:hypothetical protein